MDLFGPYGMFLIRFGFLCIFFCLLGIVEIDFGSFIKIYFYFWVLLSFSNNFPWFFGNFKEIRDLYLEIIASYSTFSVLFDSFKICFDFVRVFSEFKRFIQILRGLMDLFGPYGMFLIRFGFYVSFLDFSVLSRLIFDCS